MKSEGDVDAARRLFYAHRPNNLRYLLHKRFSWMNEYCQGKESVIEVGSGPAFTKDYIHNPHFKTTDYKKQPWIDLEMDALQTHFADQSVDVVISTHMIHHLAKPVVFFREMERILKPGGLLLIQEIETSFMMRLLLRLMRHEGWSYEARVFDEDCICNDPRDPWSANCAIPQLLFSDSHQFEHRVPGFKILRNKLCECLIFPLSGGVIAKAKTINLPWKVMEWIDKLDTFLVWLCPSIFALGRSVVLEKRT